MGLLEKIFPRKWERERYPSKEYKTFFRAFDAYTPSFTTWAGCIYESEIVRAAIEATADHFAKMEAHVIGSAKPLLQTKLKAGPNEFMTWSQFFARCSTILDVTNTLIIVPILDEYDRATGIFPLLPSRCEVLEYNSEPWLSYTFANGQHAALEMWRCAIIASHQFRDDFFGETNDALDGTMKLIDIQQQGIREGVKNAATYSFWARARNWSKAEDLKEERKKFSAHNLKSESDNSGMLLFPNTYEDIHQIDKKPWVIDADQMKAINESVYNYFGVNQQILQNSATNSQLEAFYNGKLEPRAIKISEAITEMLYTRDERLRGNEFRIVSNRLQYMSVTEKISLIKTLGDRGAMMIDEARELLNYAPLPDGAGAMVPIRGEYYNVSDKEDNNADG